jgi:hypothetical protein
VLAERGELERADALLRRAVASHEAARPPRPRALAQSLRRLARVEAAGGDRAAAQATLRRALGVIEGSLGAGDPLAEETRRDLERLGGGAPVPSVL